MRITDFAALTIHLPLLDRATLSQAWRDALHTTPLRPANGAAHSLAASRAAQTGAALRSVGRSRPAIRMASLATHTTPRTRSAFVPNPPRIGALARSRCLGTPGRVAAAKLVSREQFSVTLPNGERLCILVASGRDGLIVTLLCAAHLQHDMRRALARLATGFSSRPVQVRVMDAKEVGSWKA